MRFRIKWTALAAVIVLKSFSSGALAQGSEDGLSIAGTPAGYVSAGETYVFRPTAAIPGPVVAHFEIANAPSWANFDSVDGTLSGNPSAAESGVYTRITISLTDNVSRVSLPTYSIVVGISSGPNITLRWQAPTANVDGSPLTDLVEYLIYEGATPDDVTPLEIINSGVNEVALSNLSPGVHYFAISALNSQGVQSQISNLEGDLVN